MSYEIIYERVFIEIEKGLYLPLICAGSNNCYQFSPISGREIRERNWSLITGPGTYRGVSIHEIFEYCRVKDRNKEHEPANIYKGGKFLTNKEWEKYIMRSVSRSIPLDIFLKRNSLKIFASKRQLSPNAKLFMEPIEIFKAEDYLNEISYIEEDFAILKESSPQVYNDFEIYFQVNDGEAKVYRAKPHKPFAFKQCNNALPQESKLATMYVKGDEEKNNVYINGKSTLEKDLDDYFKYIENPLYDLTNEDIDFAIEKMNMKYFTGAKCPKCGKDLIPSVVQGYAYQCLSCDEDFYNIEVKKTIK